jgi:hypothetical protein
LCVRAPKLWYEKARYIVTERHVVCERGPFRRTIERRSITFARISWSDKGSGVGDIELVRAVPTGALRRKLLLRLIGVAAPDRVWDIIRGVNTLAAPSRGSRALAQRLDPGERVIWSARPHPSRLAFLPRGNRGWASMALALGLFWVVVEITSRMAGVMVELRSAGLVEIPIAYVALLSAEAVTIALVSSIALYCLYSAVIVPARNLGSTSYLVTNNRILIQRGNDELYLDRAKVVDVVHMPAVKGARDVFLILDGPRARALAMNGAFGEMDRDPSLKPILESIDDVEGITLALARTGAREPVADNISSLPPAA